MSTEPLDVFIGYDAREAQAYRVAEFTLRDKTAAALHVVPIKHKAMRAAGLFDRPWKTDKTGQTYDERDGKPFSTDFAFTRFLVPRLNDYRGWAVFMDCDVMVMADIAELFALADEKYAVMVVQHNHQPDNKIKMDDRIQSRYFRKNWSSVILWNCAHPQNRKLDVETVNSWPGQWLHAFSWLKDSEIGPLPREWNVLVGHTKGVREPKIVHFTDGGPWFDHMQDVPYGGTWTHEYYRMLRQKGEFTEVEE